MEDKVLSSLFRGHRFIFHNVMEIDKHVVISYIKETLIYLEEEIQKDSTENAWMVGFRNDLYPLLDEQDKLTGQEMVQKINESFSKHRPA